MAQYLSTWLVVATRRHAPCYALIVWLFVSLSTWVGAVNISHKSCENDGIFSINASFCYRIFLFASVLTDFLDIFHLANEVKIESLKSHWIFSYSFCYIFIFMEIICTRVMRSNRSRWENEKSRDDENPFILIPWLWL